MHTIGVKARFSAAHSLREYGGNCENLHGHNWVVEVLCESEEVDKLGMVIDFRVLKKALKEVLETLDHRFINEVSPFDKINPSSENLARYIFEQISEKLPADKPVRLSSIKVWENEDSWAMFNGAGK